MAESKGGGIFAKAISKQFIRTKAKVLQNLGKCDKTTDEAFESYVNNVHQQQTVAARFQKELKHYMACVRALSAASRNLFEAITETYEPEWAEHQSIKSSVESLNLLWDDYQQKLNEQINTPLMTYLNNFHEVKQKIKKRERKVVDFDNARHNFISLQNAKKRDETKIAKAQEDLDEAKKIFENLNTDLHQELPDLYDRRVDFYISSFQSLFCAEEVFHQQLANVNNSLYTSVDGLSKENEKGTYRIPRPQIDHQPVPTQKSSHSSNGPGDAHSESSSVSGEKPTIDDSPVYSGVPEQDYEQVDVTQDDAMSSDPTYQATEQKDEHNKNDDDDDEYTYVEPAGTEAPNEQVDRSNAIYTYPVGDDPAVYQVPENNTPIDDRLPAGVLYQVKSTHEYTATDEDELSFKPGEVINVMKFDDSEDEDEGWLMGVIQETGKKGVFPANFTKPI